MAKKITFLLVMLFVLLAASVTALASGTSPAALDAGFTQDKELNESFVKSLEETYGDVFFDEKSETDNFVVDNIVFTRPYDLNNPLRHKVTGNIVNTSGSNNSDKIVMLMYIKINGRYVRLNSIETNLNATEGLYVLCSTVDLEYLGSNKVNDIRIITFKKSEADKLVLGKSLQITNTQVTARNYNLVEKLKIKYNEVFNNISDKTQP